MEGLLSDVDLAPGPDRRPSSQAVGPGHPPRPLLSPSLDTPTPCPNSGLCCRRSEAAVGARARRVPTAGWEGLQPGLRWWVPTGWPALPPFASLLPPRVEVQGECLLMGPPSECLLPKDWSEAGNCLAANKTTRPQGSLTQARPRQWQVLSSLGAVGAE